MRTAILAFAAIVLVAGVSTAQDMVPDPGHPRVNEVDQRLENQQNRIDQGVGNGQIGSPARAGADETRDARIANAAQRDEAAHNGHLTKHEKHRLNKRLNRNSRHIHRQRTN